MGGLADDDVHLSGLSRNSASGTPGPRGSPRLDGHSIVRQPPLFLAVILLLGVLPLLRTVEPRVDTGDSKMIQSSPALRAAAPAQYSVTAVSHNDFANSVAVRKAVQFILNLQPRGTFILTSPNSDDVAHMDVAHAAIALSKVGHAREAREAIDWLLARMTLPDSPDRKAVVALDGVQHSIDYSGSWYDHFRSNGEPRRDLTRGRGEGVGMVLIAVYAIFQEDPAYLRRVVNGVTVIDRVAQGARYLAGPALQRPDGRFYHRPDYQVSFGEEAARMTLGLRLAGVMLESAGKIEHGALALAAAGKGLAALQRGDEIKEGMAFDFYAMSLWGLATKEQSDREFTSLKQAGLLSPDGVQNWDWQLESAGNWANRLWWWLASQSIAPAQTFDWAIANATMGNVEEARRIEQRWLPLQRPDGGFSGVYLPGLKLGLGDPTSYTAARFILLARLLAEVEPRASTPVIPTEVGIPRQGSMTADRFLLLRRTSPSSKDGNDELSIPA